MARVVNPQYAVDLCCPACGRPLTWIGSWRRDHNSPDGSSFGRKPFVYVAKTRGSKRDRPVTKVRQSGAYDLETEQAYERTYTLQCSRCSWMGDESMAHHKHLSDDELREMHLYASYYAASPGIGVSGMSD